MIVIIIRIRTFHTLNISPLEVPCRFVKNLAIFVHGALKKTGQFLGGKIIDIPFKMYKIITLCMYMLTTTSYFATMSTLKYCIIICAWASGHIFCNKTVYTLINCFDYLLRCCICILVVGNS